MSGSDEPVHLPREARGKRPEFYPEPGMDEVMSMILVLAGETMGLRDRIDTIERIAAGRGIDLAVEVERFVPDQAALDEREARRQDFLARLYYVARKDAHEQATRDSADRFSAALSEIAER